MSGRGVGGFFYHYVREDNIIEVQNANNPNEYVNRPNDEGQTAMLLTKSVKMIEYLHGLGADLDFTDNDGMTRLNLECNKNEGELDLQIVECLVTLGADVNKAIETDTPLVSALTKHCPLEVVELLVNNGAILDNNRDPTKPLILLAFYNQEIVDYLLSRGVDPNTVYEESTVFDYILARRPMGEHSFALVKLFLKHGVDCNRQFENGETALTTACVHNQLPCIRLMLELNADPTIEDNLGNCPLQYLHEGTDLNELVNHIPCVSYMSDLNPDRHVRMSIDERKKYASDYGLLYNLPFDVSGLIKQMIIDSYLTKAQTPLNE